MKLILIKLIFCLHLTSLASTSTYQPRIYTGLRDLGCMKENIQSFFRNKWVGTIPYSPVRLYGRNYSPKYDNIIVTCIRPPDGSECETVLRRFTIQDPTCSPLKEREYVKVSVASEVKEDSLTLTEGIWGQIEFCPQLHFVSGFNLKCRRGRVIGIYLYCDYLVTSNYTGTFSASKTWTGSEAQIATIPNYSPATISTTDSYRTVDGASRTRNLFCKNGYAKNFDVQFLKTRIKSSSIINIGMNCWNGESLNNILISVRPSEDASLALVKKTSCPVGSAVCGIQSNSKSPHNISLSGLDDINFFCCSLPSTHEEESTCEDNYILRRIHQFENEQSETTEMSYKIQIGTSRRAGMPEQINSTINATETNYNLDTKLNVLTKFTLAKRLGKKYGDARVEGVMAITNTSDQFLDEFQIEEKINVDPKTTVRISQLIVTCGPFEIKTVWVRVSLEVHQELELPTGKYPDDGPENGYRIFYWVLAAGGLLLPFVFAVIAYKICSRGPRRSLPKPTSIPPEEELRNFIINR